MYLPPAVTNRRRSSPRCRARLRPPRQQLSRTARAHGVTWAYWLSDLEISILSKGFSHGTSFGLSRRAMFQARLHTVTESTAVRTRSPPSGFALEFFKSRSAAPGVMLFKCKHAEGPTIL